MYDNNFFKERRGKSRYSSKLVLSFIKENVFDFKSAVDIGSGTGSWLKTCSELGVEKIKGYDGHLTNLDLLEIPKENFELHDLTEPITDNNNYDLAICLEVGEHLIQDYASQLISSICKLSDNILFSAAIPGQLGVGHINEQWPEYWINLFNAMGYCCIDIIRPIIWHDSKISFWYRQNILFFSKNNKLRTENFISFNGSNLVHPDLYISKLSSDKPKSRILKKFLSFLG